LKDNYPRKQDKRKIHQRSKRKVTAHRTPEKKTEDKNQKQACQVDGCLSDSHPNVHETILEDSIGGKANEEKKPIVSGSPCSGEKFATRQEAQGHGEGSGEQKPK